MYRTFSGKILLFGEYSIIAGSRALVTPLNRYSGRLTLPADRLSETAYELPGMAEQLPEKADALPEKDDRLHNRTERDPNDPDAGKSNIELGKLLRYLKGQLNTGKLSYALNIEGLAREIGEGLYFKSTIPQQYGVGSSAALVAAVYDAFAYEKPRELPLLRKHLSEMESHYHGTSSGIDPVCCFTGQTLTVERESLHPVGIPPFQRDTKFFLLDTGEKGETGSLVKEFKSRLKNEPGFAREIQQDLSGLVDECIKCFIKGSAPELYPSIKKLSEWQLENFGSMITDEVKKIWTRGLQANDYTLKLCGSGGGGFFLGYTDQWIKVRASFNTSDYTILPLDF